jgi:ATP-binding cassette, subfamily F, member 3
VEGKDGKGRKLKVRKKAEKKAVKENKPVVKEETFSDSSKASPINKEQKKELQKQQRIFQQLEEKIAAFTKQKAELEAALTEPATYSDKQKFIIAENAYQAAAAELNKMNKEYETVFEKIMQLEAQQK